MYVIGIGSAVVAPSRAVRVRKVSLAKAATSIIFVGPKYVFCRNKRMLVTTNLLLCLSRQNTSQSMLVATNFCHDKHVLKCCREKNVLSRQT